MSNPHGHVPSNCPDFSEETQLTLDSTTIPGAIIMQEITFYREIVADIARLRSLLNNVELHIKAHIESLKRLEENLNG